MVKFREFGEFQLTCCWNLLEYLPSFPSSFKTLPHLNVLIYEKAKCCLIFIRSVSAHELILHLYHYGMSWTGCFLLLHPALIDCFYINSNTHSNKHRFRRRHLIPTLTGHTGGICLLVQQCLGATTVVDWPLDMLGGHWLIFHGSLQHGCALALDTTLGCWQPIRARRRRVRK